MPMTDTENAIRIARDRALKVAPYLELERGQYSIRNRCGRHVDIDVPSNLAGKIGDMLSECYLDIKTEFEETDEQG